MLITEYIPGPLVETHWSDAVNNEDHEWNSIEVWTRIVSPMVMAYTLLSKALDPLADGIRSDDN